MNIITKFKEYICVISMNSSLSFLKSNILLTKTKALLRACLCAIYLISVNDIQAQTTPTSQMEKLTRGVVALPSESGGQFVSWRMLGTDPLTTTFDLLRDGQPIAKNLGNRTNFTDPQGTSESQYQVAVKVDGKVVETTDAVKPWADFYRNVKLERPEGGIYPFIKDNAFVDTPYSYYPYECSVGDVDGDGVYELFVKWNPTNAQDNSQSYGKTGNVYLDCYRLDGTKLWRVDLGVNIRAGAHYTQFLVYDFDGDGHAEMICKTAPGSIDGAGNYVNQATDDEEIRQADNAKDWRSEVGKIIGGQEYLTVFDGLTGKAIHTVFYNPNRNTGYGGEADGSFDWSDTREEDKATYGNRGERYLAAVAYLDGTDRNPSAIMCRGYYTYAFLWAVDFDGKKLSTKWLHASKTKSQVERTDANGTVEERTYTSNTFGTSNSYTAYGQGNHQLAIADVDNDGCDEMIYGAATIDNDGWLLYSTGLGHGDRLHVGDLIPDRPGLEVFRCIEDKPHGCEMHDAMTGEKLYYRKAEDKGDTGACMAADIDANHRGYELWSADSTVIINSRFEPVSYKAADLGYHGFRIYWDGDLQDERYYRGSIDKLTSEGNQRLYLNGKNFYQLSGSSYADVGGASLQADLFGDWREEMICWSNTDSASINIFTTNIPSKYRVPTLMHDHYYRLAIARQNVCYNQMPMLGYYLPDTDFSYPGELPDEAAPDLTDYKLTKELDFSSMGETYITTHPNEQKGTAWENGNKRQQKIYNAATPETMRDVLAFQATYSGSGTKGWWVNSKAGGLVTEGAHRSAAVINLKKGDIVIFEATNSVDGTLTLTNGSGSADGPFTFARSNDATKYYCTMTANGQIGFCGAWRYSGAIKSIKIYSPKPMLSYTVNEICEGQTVRTTKGEVIEGKEVSIPYRWYNVVDGQLYKRDAKGENKKLEFNHYFNVTIEEQEENLIYDKTDIKNVVFLSEGEDIEGMTLCTDDNSAIRSSNSAAAYAADGNVALTRLQPGIYCLTAVIHDASTKPDSYWPFYAGSTEVARMHCTVINKQVLSSEPFALTEETIVYVGKCGNWRQGVDLVYITKTGDVPSAITNVTSTKKTDAPVYDIFGRKPNGQLMHKGIYIIQGKKTVVQK